MRKKEIASERCRKPTQIWQIFAILLGALWLGGEASAEEISIVRDLESGSTPSTGGFVSDIHSDSRGIRTSEKLSQRISESAKVDVVNSKSVTQGFGDRKIDQTVQKGIEIGLEAEDPWQNRWRIRLTSANTRQDVSQFGTLNAPYLFEHRTYSLVSGWRRTLAAGWSAEWFAGFAQCQQADSGRKRNHGVAGLRIERTFSRGFVAASLSSDVDGGGAFSSVYGSQLLRRAEVSGSVSLASWVGFRWECGVSAVRGMFEEGEMVRHAPVVVASASLDFRFARTLKGSVGYSHRKVLHRDGIRGVTGPMAAASLTYQIF